MTAVIKKAEGAKKFVIKEKLKFKDCKNCLKNEVKITAKF